jgi:uncharacterized RDD family membrane protein YckC
MSDQYFASSEGTTEAPVWELSGWWRRVGASILDNIIVLVPVFVLLSVLGVGDEESRFDWIGSLATLAVAAAYYVGTMTAWNGQTIGKKALEIRVVREDGQAMTPWFAFYREILVMALLFGYLAIFTLYIATFLNYLWPLWDQKHQALHDKIVHSRVVRANQVSDPGSFQEAQTEVASQPAPAPVQPQVPDLPAPPGVATPPAAPAPEPPPVQPPSAPPAPPVPGGTPTPYTPPPGYENPVPEDD